jgi:hypothetical protein
MYRRGNRREIDMLLRRINRRRVTFVEARNKTRVETSGDELFIVDDVTEERQRRRNTSDLVLVERAT